MDVNILLYNMYRTIVIRVAGAHPQVKQTAHTYYVYIYQNTVYI